MTVTIFDKIISKEIPSDIIYEDDQYLAFSDINPQAPVHILIIPKKRIPTINDLESSDGKTIGEMILIAKNIAKTFVLQCISKNAEKQNIPLKKYEQP